MKLGEMAELLHGLATTFEKFLGKPTVNDLRVVGECLSKFADENVSTFCNFVIRAREGKPEGRRAVAATDNGKVGLLVERIRQFLDQRDRHDYAAVRQLATDAGKLKVSEIKAVGERIGCPLPDRTKAQLVQRLEDWLTNIKLSADQSSFTLASATGT